MSFEGRRTRGGVFCCFPVVICIVSHTSFLLHRQSLRCGQAGVRGVLCWWKSIFCPTSGQWLWKPFSWVLCLAGSELSKTPFVWIDQVPPLPLQFLLGRKYEYTGRLSLPSDYQCLGWPEHGIAGARETGTVNRRGNLSKVKEVTRKMGWTYQTLRCNISIALGRCWNIVLNNNSNIYLVVIMLSLD